MKRVTVGFSVLAVAAFLVVGCNKKQANVAPEQDTEVQSAIDATWATLVVTDLDMICAFLGENELLTHFYTPIPDKILGTTNGTFTAIRDISSKYLIMSWNGTRCLDGRYRDGSVFMNYSIDASINPDTNPNAYYYRVPGFSGALSMSNYKVDGWTIELYDGAAPAYVYNRIKEYNWNPAATKMIWEIGGKFKFTHPTDPKQNIVWEGKIYKTLENTSDPKVFSPKKDAAINWSLATVSYSGDISGLTSANVPFKMHIATKPIVRDFTCRPEKIEGVALTATTGVLATVNSEHHPFISGIASFTTSNKYPREIYFGNEDHPDLPPQCDDAAEVLIKGISYRIDLRK